MDFVCLLAQNILFDYIKSASLMSFAVVKSSQLLTAWVTKIVCMYLGYCRFLILLAHMSVITDWVNKWARRYIQPILVYKIWSLVPNNGVTKVMLVIPTIMAFADHSGHHNDLCQLLHHGVDRCKFDLQLLTECQRFVMM